MLWTEKYRPKMLDEMVGNDDARAEIRKWALAWEAGKPQKPLLLVGPPGVGKTAAAYALANEFNWELIEMNASDERKADRVLRILGSASVSSSFSGRRKLILIDEVDGIQGREDRGGVSAILKVLRSATNPVILTANDEYASPVVQVKGLCKVVRFKRVNYRLLAAYVAKILEREGVRYEMDALLELCRRESGDVRSTLLDLQAIAEKKWVVGADAVKIVGFRDRETNIFDVLRAVFKSERVIRPFTLTATLDMDPDMFKSWVVENVPREYEDPEEIAEAFHWISRADVFDGRIIRRQYWGFLAYSTELMVNGAIIAKRKKYRKFTKYDFPNWIRLQSRYKSRRSMLLSIAKKVCPVLHISAKEFVHEFKLFQIFFTNKRWAANLVALARLSPEEVAFILDRSPSSAEVESIMDEAEKIRRKVLRKHVVLKRREEGGTKEEGEKEGEQGKQATLFDYMRPAK